MTETSIAPESPFLFVPTPEAVASELHDSALSLPGYSRRYIRHVAELGVDLAEVARLERERADLLDQALAGGRFGRLVTESNRREFVRVRDKARAALRLLGEASGKAVA